MPPVHADEIRLNELSPLAIGHTFAVLNAPGAGDFWKTLTHRSGMTRLT